MSTHHGTSRDGLEADREAFFGAGSVADPYQIYDRQLQECPIHRGRPTDGFDVPTTVLDAWPADQQFTVVSYEGVTDVLRRSHAFSSTWYEHSLNAFIGPTVIGVDQPDHTRMRALLRNAFSRRQVPRWEVDVIQPIVDAQLMPLRPLGRADLFRDVGAHVPIRTIAALLGLPEHDTELFHTWALRMTSPVVAAADRIAAGNEVADYVAPIIEARRTDPGGNDLISMLVHAEVGPDDSGEMDSAGELPGTPGDSAQYSDPLTADEVNSFIRLLIIAGASTTYRAYGNLMLHLLTNPEYFAQVRDDRSLVERAIDESLRLEQPVVHFGRLALADTTVLGEPVAAGCPVNVNVGAANHDPAVWNDAHAFDLHRPNVERHLTFGYGIHRCLGVHLAKSELIVLLNRTIDLLPNLRLADDPPSHFNGLGFRMPTHVAVEFDVQHDN